MSRVINKVGLNYVKMRKVNTQLSMDVDDFGDNFDYLNDNRLIAQMNRSYRQRKLYNNLIHKEVAITKVR